MTREEAVHQLQFILDVANHDDCNAKEIDALDEEAINMAIKALEQEPCEDAISREDALMCMTGEYLADMKYSPEDIISTHIRRIRRLPSVIPKQKTGHWIDEGIYADGSNAHAYRCSECGEHIIEYEPDNYCKFCGAKMGSEEQA